MASGTERLTKLASCAGCAGKAGMRELSQVLEHLSDLSADQPDLLVGLTAPDDAAVYRLNDEQAGVLTVDFFAPLVDDAYDYGAISATNAMSDVYAMGGEVVLALNIAAFPEDMASETIARIIQGGAEKVREAGGVIAGGRTILDDEPKAGLCVRGLLHPDATLRTGTPHARRVLFRLVPSCRQRHSGLTPALSILQSGPHRRRTGHRRRLDCTRGVRDARPVDSRRAGSDARRCGGLRRGCAGRTYYSGGHTWFPHR